MKNSGCWWKDGVIYQIYPRSFCDTNGDGIGDLPGITRNLDYLQDLGVDGIWLSPINTSPMFDFGYDVSDYRAIDQVFGTMKDFEQLIAGAHRRGISVLMDLVINHSSHLHRWFEESRSSRDNPKRDWYIWHDGQHGKVPNNWCGVFGGRAWEWDDKTGQFYYHSFLKEQPDFNWRNRDLRKAVLGEMKFWLDRGADGFRLDVANYYVKDDKFRNNPIVPGKYPRPWDWQRHIYDRDRPETHGVLKELRSLTDRYRERMMVAELFTHDDPQTSAAYLGNGEDELHLSFDFSLLHQKSWDAGRYSRVLERWYQAIPAKGWPCNVLSNHDKSRVATRIGGGPHNEARAKIAAALLLTSKGTPFLYYGEEIGMRDGVVPKKMLQDPVGIKYWPFNKGRDPERTPMQWSPRPNAGFTEGNPWLPVNGDYREINVERAREDKASILNLCRSLISLRMANPALRTGEWIPVKSTDNVLAYYRTHESARILVLLNFSGRTQATGLRGSDAGSVLFSTHRRAGEKASFGGYTMSPHEITLLKLEKNSKK